MATVVTVVTVVLDRAGVRPVHQVPSEVEVTERDTCLFFLNHGTTKAVCTLDRAGIELLSGPAVEAGESLVLDAGDAAVVRRLATQPQA